MIEQSVDKQYAQNYGEHIASSRDASKIKCLWTGIAGATKTKLVMHMSRLVGRKQQTNKKTETES